MKINPQHIYFILVEPQSPGNVGASARALKTMGFTHLRVVNPCEYDVPEGRRLAHASEDIFENIQQFDSLEEALSGMNFVVATTQREREYHLPFYTPTELGEKAIPLSQAHRFALVFGREKTGLTNKELCACHAISTVPAAVNHPSLNLAQTVMLYAYELYQYSYGQEKSYQWDLAEYHEMEGVYAHLRTSLQKTQFIPRDDWNRFIMRFRRIFARANPEARDVRLLHKIFQAFDEHIQHLENRLRKHSIDF